MNDYIKNEIRYHVWLYKNGFNETLDIVCPKAGVQIMMARIVYAINNNKDWDKLVNMLFDFYRKGMYPEIKQPTLIQRIRMKIDSICHIK